MLDIHPNGRLEAVSAFPSAADRAEASLRRFERHSLPCRLGAASVGEPAAPCVVPLWSLPDLLLLAPSMFALRAAAPYPVLRAFVFPEVPVWGADALHGAVRQRDSPGIGTDERRDVDVKHIG